MKRGRLNSNCPNLNPLTSNKIDEVYIWAYFNNDELFKSDRVSFNTSAAGVRALRLLQACATYVCCRVQQKCCNSIKCDF